MTSDLPVSSRHTAGFTLMELLVALGLTGLIMGAVLTLNLRTNDAATTLQTRTELTGEVQVAQNYIASKLRNAVYVFPYYSLASTFTLATSGYSTFNPATRAGRTGTGNYTWRYASGTLAADPFLAFVLPPEGGNSVAPGSCAGSTANSDKQANCYVFYAYYAVPRSLLVTGGGGATPTGANRLQSDGSNDTTTWALMEYRAYYAATGYGSGSTGAIPMGGTGLLVLDYVRPTTETTTGATVDKLFVASTTPVTAVTLNLAVTRQVGDETVNVPAAGRYSLRVYPRNLSNATPNN
jgi:type II secretory pathway pseudopilin PulG